MPRLVCPILILNIVLASIFVPLSKVIGMVRLRTSSVCQASPGELVSSYRQCRKDEIALCRARIGHTHQTHSYILKKGPPPQCEHCQCSLKVRQNRNKYSQTGPDDAVVVIGYWAGRYWIRFSVPAPMGRCKALRPFLSLTADSLSNQIAV